MIKRYSVREIEKIFSDSNKYSIWLDIELAVLKYLSKQNIISKESYKRLFSDLVVVPKQVREKEKVSNHDVVAFIHHICDTTSSLDKKWIHYGLTSSDLVDTANSVMLKQANQIISRKIREFLKRLKRLSFAHRNSYFVNRDKGFQVKGATSFGYRIALCYEDVVKAADELEKYRGYIECASISGSMGICSHIDVGLQDFVAKELGLGSAPCSTQVLSRDRYYRYFELLNRIIQSIYELCVELRYLARTEVGEVAEAFYGGQIGSSSMPHKRNPITMENICGLCRLFGAYCTVNSKNIPIWFERDISHSSVDRVVFLDGLSIACQVLNRFTRVLSGLMVDTKKMEKNIENNQFLVFKDYIVKELYKKYKGDIGTLELGIRLDQLNDKARASKVSFKDMLVSEETNGLELFDLNRHLGFIDKAYERIYGKHHVRECFDTVFFEEGEILSAIDALAFRLNTQYQKAPKSIRIIAFREHAVIFLAHLLPKLNFSIDFHTVNVDAEWALINEEEHGDFHRDFIRGQEILILGGLFKSKRIIEQLRDRMAKLGARNVSIVSLFASSLEQVDLCGLVLPTLHGVAGFGLDNGEGLFRNVGCVGKLKPNFIVSF